ncbi:Signal peptide peptidase-like 2 [Bienertia sinuspersici]
MVCEPDETGLNIHITAVMLRQTAGVTLEKMLTNGSLVSVLLYSPQRPVVNVAEVFLWLMAVGTILCASYWSTWSAREAIAEHEKLLKVNINCSPIILCIVVTLYRRGEHQHNINPVIFFVASCFVVILYKLMSSWLIDLLMVLFCIGGAEVKTCSLSKAYFCYL